MCPFVQIQIDTYLCNASGPLFLCLHRSLPKTVLSQGTLTERFQLMTTSRTREEMDKIPYIKYARYFILNYKSIGFEWQFWFFKLYKRQTTKCGLFI